MIQRGLGIKHADQVRVLVVFTALSAAAVAFGVWVFERRDL